MGELAFEDASAAGRLFQRRTCELHRVGTDVVVGHGHERRGGVGLHGDDHPGLLRGHELAGVAVDAERQGALNATGGAPRAVTCVATAQPSVRPSQD